MKYVLEIINRERCFSGFLRLVHYRLRHSLSAGGWGPVIERERIGYFNSAAAILYDALRDQLVMVEQFRIGALEHGLGAAGGLDSGTGGWRPESGRGCKRGGAAGGDGRSGM